MHESRALSKVQFGKVSQGAIWSQGHVLADSGSSDAS
jgi:hypothetical protein